MLTESATVVDARDGYLWVESQSRSGCSQCASSTCTTSVVAKLFGVRTNRLRLENTLDAKPGQRVEIGIPDELLVSASVWAYLVPLLLMFATAIVAQVLGLDQGTQSVMAMAGLAAGFYLVRLRTSGHQARRRFVPKLLRIHEEHSVRIEFSELSRSKP
jgi:sigma-E factor negative regulatory protein RseC